MKKESYYKFLYIISILLLIGFVLGIVVDYYKYDAITTSAPFYVNILVRAIEYLIPSIIVFILGLIFKRKFSK